MGIVGIVALVAAAVGLFVWRSQGRSMRQMTSAETLSCGDLDVLVKAASDVVGAGSFSQQCEVVGVAAAGEHGLLKAPDSGRDVVWHRTLVTEHYWDETTESDGSKRRVDKTRVMSEHRSEDQFLVQDDTGTIVVDPREADVDSAPKLVERIDRDSNHLELGSGTLANLAEGMISSARSDRTTGIEHEEWGIPAGQRLYVLAEASDRGGRLAMVSPDDGGGFTISARTEAEMQQSARTARNIALGISVALGVTGVVLLLLERVL